MKDIHSDKAQKAQNTSLCALACNKMRESAVRQPTEIQKAVDLFFRQISIKKTPDLSLQFFFLSQCIDCKNTAHGKGKDSAENICGNCNGGAHNIGKRGNNFLSHLRKDSVDTGPIDLNFPQFLLDFWKVISQILNPDLQLIKKCRRISNERFKGVQKFRHHLKNDCNDQS